MKDFFPIQPLNMETRQRRCVVLSPLLLLHQASYLHYPYPRSRFARTHLLDEKPFVKLSYHGTCFRNYHSPMNILLLNIVSLSLDIWLELGINPFPSCYYPSRETMVFRSRKSSTTYSAHVDFFNGPSQPQLRCMQRAVCIGDRRLASDV